MNKKKILTLCVVAWLAITAIAGASLAYFTDTKTVNNTFTVGNVEIELIESDVHRKNPESGLLNNPAFPGNAVQSDETIKSRAREYTDIDVYPGFNVIKAPYVINTGSNAAYVRVHYMIPVTLFKLIDDGPSYWTTSLVGTGDGYTNDEKASCDAIKYYFNNGYKMDEYTTTNVDGVEYYDFCFTYHTPIEAGNMTYWSCWGNIKIPESATSEDFEGVDSFKIIVTADAIQADGFTDTVDSNGDVTATAWQNAWAAFDKA